MRTFLWIAAVAFVLSGCDNDKGPAPSTKVEAVKTEAAKADAGKAVASKADAPKAAIPDAVDLGKAVVGSALAATKAEIACAHCVYKMDGITSCQPAVKVGGQTLLLTGAAADAVKDNADIHKAAKSVMLAGKIEGKNYVATKVEIAK